MTTLNDIRDASLVYVATPYSKYRLGQAIAAIHACKATAELMRLGFAAVSPIAHSHYVALHGALDNMDAGLWQRQDLPLMLAADACVVVMLEGWRESVGVRDEIQHFVERGKPVVFWDMEETTAAS